VRTILLCFALFCSAPLCVVGSEPELPDQIKGTNPPRPQKDRAGVSYCGIVKAVEKNTLTLQGPKDGPRTFILSEALAKGEIPMNRRVGLNQYFVQGSYMYRVSDVKVGDWLIIYYARLGEVDVCDHISIEKRPGGRVPPLPAEAENLRRPEGIVKANNPNAPEELLADLRKRPHIEYHEWKNAYWDLVDKGIAYPEKFGDSRMFPVAPAPREKR
jgi:hypothetical protein